MQQQPESEDARYMLWVQVSQEAGGNVSKAARENATCHGDIEPLRKRITSAITRHQKGIAPTPVEKQKRRLHTIAGGPSEAGMNRLAKVLNEALQLLCISPVPLHRQRAHAVITETAPDGFHDGVGGGEFLAAAAERAEKRGVASSITAAAEVAQAARETMAMVAMAAAERAAGWPAAAAAARAAVAMAAALGTSSFQLSPETAHSTSHSSKSFKLRQASTQKFSAQKFLLKFLIFLGPLSSQRRMLHQLLQMPSGLRAPHIFVSSWSSRY